MTIIEQYEHALKKAQATEKLQCHVLEIENILKRLKSGKEPTVLEEVWIDYFLNSTANLPLDKVDYTFYAEMYEKSRDIKDEKISLLTKEIEKLKESINALNNVNLLEEIYNAYNIESHGISLQDFKKGVYTVKTGTLEEFLNE